MAPKLVTDPAILAQLNGGEASAPTAPRKVVDPAVLAQLNGEGPSKTESGARGGLQGLSFGWGDEATGALAAILPFAAQEELTPPKGQSAPKTLGERYRMARDYYRRRNQAAQNANPASYMAGEVAGAILPAVATMGGSSAATAGSGAAKTLPLAARMARGARAGAALGVAGGAGASDADTASGVAGDAALGGATGLVAGGALPAVGAGLRRGAGWASEKLRARGIESGRKALSGIGTPLSARKEIPEAAVTQALDTKVIKPLGTVTGARDRLLAQADKIGEVYRGLVQDLEAAGVTGPNAELMAREALKKAQDAGKVLARAEKGEWEALATDLRAIVDPKPFASKRLGLTQALDITRNLQEEARSQYDKIARQLSPKGAALKKTAAFSRQSVEDAVEEQANKAPDLAAQFRPVKSRLANTMEGLKWAEEGASRAARRAAPSMTIPATVAAVSGSPSAALLPLLARLGDRRVSSTLARSAWDASKLLGAAGRAEIAPATQQEASNLAALIAALRAPRGVPSLATAEDEESK